MEDYLNHTFTQDDIDNYISSQAEESINLDFKRGDALRKSTENDKDKIKADIAKDVSAFANSDGGIIIYGIEEKNYKADKTFFVNGNEFTKETLEQIINTRIQRKIEGLIIDPIRYNGKIDETIYVVKIPRSLNAPHMTSDKKFYRRYNFESVVMEEYEVRALYTRQEKTHLEIAKPKIIGNLGSLQGGMLSEFNANIEINIINKGQSIEKLYKVEVHIPRVTALFSDQFIQQAFFSQLARTEGDHTIFSIPNKSPLFQNETATVAVVVLKINFNDFHDIERHPVIVKLFYTNGTEEMSFMLLENLEYKGNKLKLEDFRRN